MFVYGKARKCAAYHRRGFPVPKSLLYQKSLFFAPSVFENASRTVGSLFEHGAHIPYHRRPSPVPNEPNATNAKNAKCHKCHKCQGKEASSPHGTTGKFLANARKKPFPAQHHQQIPRSRIPRGSRELFIPAAVLPRTDLTIF